MEEDTAIPPFPTTRMKEDEVGFNCQQNLMDCDTGNKEVELLKTKKRTSENVIQQVENPTKQNKCDNDVSTFAKSFKDKGNSERASILNNDENQSVHKALTLPDFFDKDNKGPYGVWLRKINLDDTVLNAHDIGSIIFRKYKSIKDIFVRGKFKAEVFFKDRLEANQLFSDVSLRKHNLETFLPGFRKFRKGIVRNIPIHYTEEEILQGCSSQIKVCEVRRLTRKNENSTSDEDKRIPSNSILLFFAGQVLPNEVFIFNVRDKVLPYVQSPRQCYNCFGFGHIGSNCRNKKVCVNCGAPHMDNNPSCVNPVPTCRNCGEGHKSIDQTCPEFKKHRAINKAMAFENLSYVEAREKVLISMRCPIQTKENFPALKERYSQVVNGIAKGTETSLSQPSTSQSTNAAGPNSVLHNSNSGLKGINGTSSMTQLSATTLGKDLSISTSPSSGSVANWTRELEQKIKEDQDYFKLKNKTIYRKYSRSGKKKKT